VKRELVAVAAALVASAGAYWIYTSVEYGWGGRAPKVGLAPVPWRQRPRTWMRQAGLDVGITEFVTAVVVVAGAGAAVAYVLFGGVLPTVVAAMFSASFAVSAYRTRRRAVRAAALEAWPRLLEELRMRTGSLGRSVPQALFEAGRRGPEEWGSALAAAEREWLLTTDFHRTVSLLKDSLADPTADAVCETLVVAHEIGGSDLDARLAELIEDRLVDLQCRKDAESRQAGVRFARRFVLAVPLGMALAGLAIGSGRASYQTAGGQVAVAVSLLAVVACWIWSGRLMRMPSEPRVFR
jgi:tight adherence protein B